MIIRSLIQDESKVTLDCAKATLQKGSVISIDDKHWRSAEVQGAISCGFAELVGAPPCLPEDPAKGGPERKMKYKNVYHYKLAFECVKNYVEPGELIEIPLSKLDEVEIRNAIGSGWLLDIENPNSFVRQERTAPVELEELSVSDILNDQEDVKAVAAVAAVSAVKMPAPPMNRPAPKTASVPMSRPKPAPKPGVQKAKRISSSGDREEDEVSDDELYRPSEIRLPTEQPIRPAAPAADLAPPARQTSHAEPMEISGDDGEDDGVTWADIFGKGQ